MEELKYFNDLEHKNHAEIEKEAGFDFLNEYHTKDKKVWEVTRAKQEKLWQENNEKALKKVLEKEAGE